MGLDCLGAVLRPGDEFGPFAIFVQVAPLRDERLVGQLLGHDDMGQRGQHRDIGAGLQRQVIARLDMGGADHVDPPRIDDDQFRALAQAPLHPAGEDRMPVCRVCPDHDHHIRLHHAVEILRAGGGAEGGLQAVAGRRVADAGAGIDIVVAEAGADQFLDEESLLVRAA